MTQVNPLYGERPAKKVPRQIETPVEDFLLHDEEKILDQLRKAQKLYIVIGETGEDDDHMTWEVAAFDTQEKAGKYVRAANQWLHENGLHEYDVTPGSNREETTGNCPFDANLVVDYFGAKYSVKIIDFYKGKV